MAKIISANDLFDLLKPEVKVVENNLDVTALLPIYEAHLPEGITMDTVKTVHSYDSRFFEGYARAVTDKLPELIKGNNDLAAVEAALDIEGHRMSVAFSRPQGEEIDAKAWAASVGFGYGVPKPETLQRKLSKSFAAAMTATEDEEE